MSTWSSFYPFYSGITPQNSRGWTGNARLECECVIQCSGIKKVKKARSFPLEEHLILMAWVSSLSGLWMLLSLLSNGSRLPKVTIFLFFFGSVDYADYFTIWDFYHKSQKWYHKSQKIEMLATIDFLSSLSNLTLSLSLNWLIWRRFYLNLKLFIIKMVREIMSH